MINPQSSDIVFMRPSVDGTLLITVYRTDVLRKEQADGLLDALGRRFPACQFTFDLWDNDRVFRVASRADIHKEIVETFHAFGFSCEVL